MNKHIVSIFVSIKNIGRQVHFFHRDLSKRKKIAAYSVYIVLFCGVFFLLQHKNTTGETQKEFTRTVEVRSVKELSNSGLLFPFLGTVTSVNEAVIRAETSGKLISVRKKLGDKVVAGEIIAIFENSAEQASLLQAEGAYDAAKAGSAIASLSGNNTASTLSEAKNSAVNTLHSTQNALEDAVFVKTDMTFTDPKSPDLKMLLSVPDANLVYSIEKQRAQLEKIISERAAKNKTITTESDLLTELQASESEVQQVKNYLDDVARAYTLALVSSTFNEAAITSGKAQVSAARSEITGALSSLSLTRSSLNNSLTAKLVADKTSGNGVAITSSEAGVKQALGAYNAALSRYEKTIIRSPLSGTLNSLSIETGDYITSFSQIGVVSNNGTLEVKAEVSEEDAKRIVTGMNVAIQKDTVATKGIVTRVAEAIDPLTKKIEVRVGILDEKSNLVNGESVTLSLDQTSGIKKENAVPEKILAPLSALKMTPDGALIFQIDGTGVAHSKHVQEGAIFGENIEILSGLVSEDVIVVDARGLKDGMHVTLKK